MGKTWYCDQHVGLCDQSVLPRSVPHEPVLCRSGCIHGTFDHYWPIFQRKKERRIFPLSFKRQPYVLDKFGIGRLSHILSLSVLDCLRGPRYLGGIPAASSVESIDPVYVRNLYAWIYHLKKESLQVVL